MLLERIRSDLARTLGPFLVEMGVEDEAWVATVSRADPHVVGDVALPCFTFAKAAKMSPSDIAERLLGYLESLLAAGDVSFSWCSGVVAVGGYLNLHLDRGWVIDQIDERWDHLQIRLFHLMVRLQGLMMLVSCSSRTPLRTRTVPSTLDGHAMLSLVTRLCVCNVSQAVESVQSTTLMTWASR